MSQRPWEAAAWGQVFFIFIPAFSPSFRPSPALLPPRPLTAGLSGLADWVVAGEWPLSPPSWAGMAEGSQQGVPRGLNAGSKAFPGRSLAAGSDLAP